MPSSPLLARPILNLEATGVPLWEGTIVDELRGREELNAHAPDSQSREAAAPGSAPTPSPRSDEDTP